MKQVGQVASSAMNLESIVKKILNHLTICSGVLGVSSPISPKDNIFTNINITVGKKSCSNEDEKLTF